MIQIQHVLIALSLVTLFGHAETLVRKHQLGGQDGADGSDENSEAPSLVRDSRRQKNMEVSADGTIKVPDHFVSAVGTIKILDHFVDSTGSPSLSRAHGAKQQQIVEVAANGNIDIYYHSVDSTNLARELRGEKIFEHDKINESSQTHVLRKLSSLAEKIVQAVQAGTFVRVRRFEMTSSFGLVIVLLTLSLAIFLVSHFLFVRYMVRNTRDRGGSYAYVNEIRRLMSPPPGAGRPNSPGGRVLAKEKVLRVQTESSDECTTAAEDINKLSPSHARRLPNEHEGLFRSQLERINSSGGRVGRMISSPRGSFVDKLHSGGGRVGKTSSSPMGGQLERVHSGGGRVKHISSSPKGRQLEGISSGGGRVVKTSSSPRGYRSRHPQSSDADGESARDDHAGRRVRRIGTGGASPAVTDGESGRDDHVRQKASHSTYESRRLQRTATSSPSPSASLAVTDREDHVGQRKPSQSAYELRRQRRTASSSASPAVTDGEGDRGEHVVLKRSSKCEYEVRVSLCPSKSDRGRSRDAHDVQENSSQNAHESRRVLTDENAGENDHGSKTSF